MNKSRPLKTVRALQALLMAALWLTVACHSPLCAQQQRSLRDHAYLREVLEKVDSLVASNYVCVRLVHGSCPVRRACDGRPGRYHGRLTFLLQGLGFFRLEWLEGNVGYLDLRRFHPISESKAMVDAAMSFMSAADAIVIDLRENRGGAGERTFSAAEMFAYDLQVRNRATLVGEPTGGGAHSVDLYKIHDLFEIYIPTDRAINPVTSGNWEGTGVIPDVAVSAEAALDTAVVLARAAASAGTSSRSSATRGCWSWIRRTATPQNGSSG